MVIWYVSVALGPYSSSDLCVPRPSISLILDLIALLPIPTSPHPTQASLAATILFMAKLIMYLHLRTVFFRFPCCQPGSHSVALLIAISTYPDDALNDPRIIAFATHFHNTHSSPVSVCQPPAFISSLQTPANVQCIICRQNQASR